MAKDRTGSGGVGVMGKVVGAYRCPERLRHVFEWYGVRARNTPKRVRLLGKVVEI